MSKITSVEELAKKVKKLSVLYKASEADIEIIEAFIRTTLTNRDKEIVALAKKAVELAENDDVYINIDGIKALYAALSDSK